MSETVVQWLAEIRTLKQKMTQMQQELDAAKENESNWRQLYSQEAQQRRTETKLAQEQMSELKAQIQEIQAGLKLPKVDTTEAEAAIAQELVGLDTVEQLKTKLTEVLRERDRALEALKIEQENHTQTRKSLTAVISDTMDQLTKLKSENPASTDQ